MQAYLDLTIRRNAKAYKGGTITHDYNYTIILL